jgi:putative transposase
VPLGARVERIWRREGLKVPQKQPKRGRLWLTDGSCIRLRPQHRNHVWSYDFVEDRTHDGRRYRMLNVIDEFTHECLAIRLARKLKAIDVIDVLSDLFILRGVPGHIRSDNGREFVAKAVQEWITAVGAKTAYITMGSPWENGYVESFNARLRDELFDGEIFYTWREAQIIIESWRRHFSTIRPHASLGYKPPASPQVFVSVTSQFWPLASSVEQGSLAPEFIFGPFASFHFLCHICSNVFFGGPRPNTAPSGTPTRFQDHDKIPSWRVWRSPGRELMLPPLKARPLD